MSFAQTPVEESAHFVKTFFSTFESFDVALVLGSGLGSFHTVLKDAQELSYQQIPHMPHTTVVGHEGKLIAGKLGAKSDIRVLCFSGRFHAYEGIPWSHVCFPVQLTAALNIPMYILTNATGI